MSSRAEAAPVPPPPADDWVQAVHQRLLNWGSNHFEDYPWRHRIPFWQAVVVEVLLQRTRARQVAPVFNELRRRYPRARDFGEAGEPAIRELLKPLGLHWRIPLVAQLALEIGRRNGRLPRDSTGLRDLPGVGNYAAMAALSLHQGRHAVLIDSNIVRLLARLRGASWDGETRRRPWVTDLATRLTPVDEARQFNYALLDLSMMVCRPRNPFCETCVLRDLCATGLRHGGKSSE